MANADSTNTEGSLARAIWRLELARAKHVLRAYLRTRLLKLEACCAAVLADQGMQTRLSQRELQYAHVSLCMLDQYHATTLFSVKEHLCSRSHFEQSSGRVS